jgi:hypothetical protein
MCDGPLALRDMSEVCMYCTYTYTNGGADIQGKLANGGARDCRL